MMKQFLLGEFQKRPLMVLEDCVKLLFQRFFGPGHLIADRNIALSRLEEEIASLKDASLSDEAVFEPLGNGFCRLNLRAALAAGLSPQTISGMFFQSARDLKENMPDFLNALDVLEDMIQSGLLPFHPEESRLFLSRYRLSGCPALSHSSGYRAAYAPAYRVVSDVCARFFPLFLHLDHHDCARIAIDGRCGGGKSTLAEFLSGVYDCPLVHADDFFLRPSQRTPERMQEIGGNMDRERLRDEVLEPLKEGKDAYFRPFSCSEQKIGEPVFLPCASRVIIEGSYCLHPDLQEYYDLKVFVSVEPSLQQQRILKRNGEMMLKRFIAEWIPREEAYFNGFSIREICDFVFD